VLSPGGVSGDDYWVMTWEAEEELYRQLGSRMVALASVTVGPSAAADVVSQTVEELLKRGRWTKANDPAAYAMRAVVLTSRSYVRGESRRRGREDRSLAEEGPSTEPVQVHSAAMEMLCSLSAQQRAVAYLTYWEDLAPQAIAKLLNISEGSVKRQLARARSNLRKALT
jgi:RNA polymerase sigma factor (sigma-70 family)